MSFAELFLLALALSMDAFAVAVCKGLSMQKTQIKSMVIVGLWFGGFQALMPAIGYLLGSAFEKYIVSFDHWVAFALLALIGGNMVREAFSKKEEPADSSLGVKTMLVMAIATSIDALAAGITFILDGVNVPVAVTLIGITTFILSAAGVKVGSVFGTKYKSRAELTGGVVLILLGIKILLEHTGIL